MITQQTTHLRLVAAPAETSATLVQGLVDLHKAVKGAGFYPHGHPYRTETLQRVYDAFLSLASERELVLHVSRQGIMQDKEPVEGGVMVLQLAHECFIRRVASVIFMQDLLLCDLEVFVELLSGDPYKSASSGGFARQLEEKGVSTIWVNEKDLDTIWAKRAKASFGEPDDDGDSLEEPEPESDHTELTERPTVAEVLELMAREPDEERYRGLGRELVDHLDAEPGAAPILPVLVELLRQHQDQQKSLPQREFALFILKNLADGAADLLLDHLESREFQDKKSVHRVLAALGGKGAYWIIQRICLAAGLFERKALATALVSLGSTAIAPTLAMLKDERWYVVRNMVAILGELRCADTVTALKNPLYHEDVRVRKETVRALLKINGEVAEGMLVPLLEEADEGLVRHAILALGLMRSRQAVPLLLKLLERRDLLLKGLQVKKEIMVALGRIGDRRATAPLLKMLASRGWPVLGRWLELKIAAAAALGALGDEAALPALSELAAGKGALAEACRESQDAIERVSGGSV